jgi:hypothetical protein
MTIAEDPEKPEIRALVRIFLTLNSIGGGVTVI